ncbi:unnamed protein product [Acanthoscelides obtectus]|uniref:C2H2-type domain-containing protein n=1 Tax=Acanthoscelides obtectus TaxID=200917 RepID=A0A9P0JMN0_ACAOB|nr:unnamed protein product [Acanthoscelides obtectus]CAK1665738.1 RE1-silencing transcription factor [Acanthoscelides obtectus]
MQEKKRKVPSHSSIETEYVQKSHLVFAIHSDRMSTKMVDTSVITKKSVGDKRTENVVNEQYKLEIVNSQDSEGYDSDATTNSDVVLERMMSVMNEELNHQNMSINRTAVGTCNDTDIMDEHEVEVKTEVADINVNRCNGDGLSFQQQEVKMEDKVDFLLTSINRTIKIEADDEVTVKVEPDDEYNGTSSQKLTQEIKIEKEDDGFDEMTNFIKTIKVEDDGEVKVKTEVADDDLWDEVPGSAPKNPVYEENAVSSYLHAVAMSRHTTVKKKSLEASNFERGECTTFYPLEVSNDRNVEHLTDSDKPKICLENEYGSHTKSQCTSSKMSGKEVSVCRYCNITLPNKLCLDVHLSLCSRSQTFKCLECTYETSAQQKLRIHTRAKHATFMCRYCNVTFPNKNCLIDHMDKCSFIVSGETFKCSKCAFEASVRVDLTWHMRTTHVTFVCKYCNVTFPNKDSLSDHMTVCGKTFKCSKCTYKSPIKRNLTRHMMRKHDKTFKCSKCAYKTTTKQNLTRHIRREHVTFECSICIYKTRAKRNFTKHIKIKHPTLI